MNSFDHQRLDVGRAGLKALVLGEAMARELPRGYAGLGDQLRRALSGAYLQTTEGIVRRGRDRAMRLRVARAEANEAAAAVDALKALGLASESASEELLVLLDSICRMLSGLERRS